MGSDNPFRSLRLSNHIQIGPFWLAVLTVLLGLVLRFLIDPWLGDQMPYITFLVSVAVTGLYAGVRPALLSTALGAALAYFCFVPPRYHWGFAGMSDAVGFLSYLAAALGIVVLTRARNKAHEETQRTLQDRIDAERRLRDAQKLFQVFLENRPGCAYLRDQTGRYVYYNVEARLLLGIDNGNATGTSELRMKLESQDQQALAPTGGPMQFVDKVTLRGEELYWLTAKFIFVDEQRHKFVGSLSLDITSQMQAEQVVLETERLAAAGQMVAMVAHEINNPLAAVTSSLFLLGRETLPRSARELVAIAQDELSRLTHITSLAIGFYKQTELPVAIDPCGLVDDVLIRLTAQFSGKRARIQRNFKWNGVFVACPSQIRQALDNVVANSFESGAGQILVRVARSNDWHMPSRSGLRISVFDDGCGMHRQQCKKAFGPFYSTKTEKGRGLGLWIAKAVVLRNGGHITLRSTDNPGRHGTCVSIFLPDLVAAGPAVSLNPDIELRQRQYENHAADPAGSSSANLPRGASHAAPA
jgi:signal transduction histidine kinase